MLKKIILISTLLLMMNIPALASETLTTPYINASLVSFPQITAMAYDWNWNTGFMSITYMYGTATVNTGKDQSFSVTPNTPVIVNVLNITNGVWVMSSNTTGQIATGTLTPGQLASAIAVFTGNQTTLRNFADQFLMGVLPGTQVDTW